MAGSNDAKSFLAWHRHPSPPTPVNPTAGPDCPTARWVLPGCKCLLEREGPLFPDSGFGVQRVVSESERVLRIRGVEVLAFTFPTADVGSDVLGTREWGSRV